MSAGDALITACIAIAFLAVVILILVSVHRSLTGTPARSEYDEFWRRDGER